MHLAIIAGGVLADRLSSPLGVLLVLVALKTVIDLWPTGRSVKNAVEQFVKKYRFKLDLKVIFACSWVPMRTFLIPVMLCGT